MERVEHRPTRIADLEAPIPIFVLTSLVAIMCYLTDRMAYYLSVPPDDVTPFWLATPLLVAVLLLVPRRIWPILIAAGVGSMAFGDFKNGVPISSIIYFSLGDLTAVLLATFGMSRLSERKSYLGRVTALVYYFVVIAVLSSSFSAFLGAASNPQGSYWIHWRLWFLSDLLAFLTVTPAILSWARDGQAWARKPSNYIELAALMAALILLGYPAFAGTWRGESPGLFYFLVPILLWAAMRLGLKGASTSMIVVAFLSVWGASQGRGPFSGAEALNNVLSLQLFLVFVSIPFMVLAGIVEDQKRAQQTLIDEQTKLNEAQHLAQIGSWEWDPESDEVTWSRELYRISGRDPGLPAPSFKEHSQLYTPESIERLKHVVDEALRIGTPYELDLEMVNRDGSTKWIRAQGEAQSDRTGRVVRLRGTTQDINERRLAERELERVNERLRLAMEAGKSVGWDRDVRTGRYTLFGNLQSIFGIPADIHNGRVNDFPRYLHSDDRELVLKTIEDAMQTHMPYAAEFRANWPDGAVRWVAARGKFYYSSHGKPERMLGMAIDITERKLAVEALRKSEEQLRLALRAGRMYAFDWDPATDMITRSEEVRHIPALKDDPLHLTKQQLLADVHPEDQEIFNSTIDHCTPENPNHQISFRLLRPDGSVLWLERTGRAFFDGQGRLVRMAGIVADITERKLAEVALSSVSGRLIEAQEQERAWIARELHDDIGQRFALMVTNLEVMKKVPPASAAEIRNFINKHLKCVREISADVQAMSHRLHSSKLQFLGIVAAARSFCQELSDQQQVEISFTYSEIPPAVSDEISLCLFRIMQESLQNAVKHSGVRHFEVELRGEPEGLHLIVRDSGVGFDPKVLVNNRGLGLISMQERVNLVKGIFSIKSSLNLGTTIHVRVPLKRGATFMSAAG